jgi:hypothetical protein
MWRQWRSHNRLWCKSVQYLHKGSLRLSGTLVFNCYFARMEAAGGKQKQGRQSVQRPARLHLPWRNVDISRAVPVRRHN